MGRIRSAWEIALERTENIVADADKIRHSAVIEEIRRKAGAYLLGDRVTEEQVASDLSSYKAEDIKEALSMVILPGVALSQDKGGDNSKAMRLSYLLSLALPGNREAQEYFASIMQHASQYPAHRDHLMEQLKAQYEPMLREKEEQMRAQYGQSVHLTFESDKECQEIARQYLEKLQKQYSDTLQEAKENLKAMLM